MNEVEKERKAEGLSFLRSLYVECLQSRVEVGA